MVIYKKSSCSQEGREVFTCFISVRILFHPVAVSLCEKLQTGCYVGRVLGSRLKPCRQVINLMGINQGGPTGMNLGAILLLFQLPNEAHWDFNTEPPESGGQRPEEAQDMRNTVGVEAGPGAKTSEGWRARSLKHSCRLRQVAQRHQSNRKHQGMRHLGMRI